MPEQIYGVTRALRKLSVTTTMPAPSASVDPTDDGVFAMADVLDFDLSGAQGSPPKVRFLAGRTSSNTYTLLIYGLLRVQSGGWVPILLFKATVAATINPGGTADDDAFKSTDRAAGAFTVDAVTPAASYQVLSAGSDGLSHVQLDTKGCPFLVFYSSDAEAFVLAGPAS